MVKLLPIVMLLFLLAGCQVAKPPQEMPMQPQPTPMQLRAHAAAQLSAVLRERGVQVVHVGETIRIIIPSDALFIGHSSNFNPEYVSTLNYVAAMMKVLESTSVKVSGYTDNHGRLKHNKLVSERQAQRVLYRLWKQGLDVRLMVAYGMGAKHPIATNRTAKGRAVNRRIEIKFQYVPLMTSLWGQET